MFVRARAPGRVNLIGDHTDYTGGWVLPMAVDLATTVEMRRHGRRVELVSAHDPEAAVVGLDVSAADVPHLSPRWARFVGGVVAAVRPEVGGTGTVHSDVPIGAGLSSSSSLTVALALALGAGGTPVEVALTCQRAEQLGSGVPGGIMDQLCSVAGRAGHALLIDCDTLAVTLVRMPEGCEVVVVHSGETRVLSGSAYSERRRQCDAAAADIGPLRRAVVSDTDAIRDPVLRRRARHVVTENARVLAAAAALSSGDLAGAGALMTESHRSLRDDFEVSTPALDALVDALCATPGVTGARLTGAGFGGCVVALAEPGAGAAGARLGSPSWVLQATGGATVEALEEDDPGPAVP